MQALVMSVFDYGDVLYMYASPATLKPLDAVYHSALRFIAGDGFLTHHCISYGKVGWLCLTIRRELPLYLSSLSSFSDTN